MALAELETLARLELPVTVVVFDDAALSLIEVKQGAGQGSESAVRFAPIDFAAVARGLGCRGGSGRDAGRAARRALGGRRAAGPVPDRRGRRREPVPRRGRRCARRNTMSEGGTA